MASSTSPSTSSEPRTSAAEVENEKHVLASVLKETSDNIKRITQQAQIDIQGSVEEFVSKRIGKLFQIVGIYKEAFENLQVKTRKEFEKKTGRHFRNEEIRESFDELLKNEEEWDEMLQNVDKALPSSNIPALKEGDEGPVLVEVVDARTDDSSLLNEFLAGHDFLILVLLRHFA